VEKSNLQKPDIFHREKTPDIEPNPKQKDILTSTKRL